MSTSAFIWAVVCSLFILAPFWFVWDYWKNGNDDEINEEEEQSWWSNK